MLEGKKTGVVILAAGKGKRMCSDTPKQFTYIAGRPLIAWTLMAFENSVADEIVLVTDAEEDYIKGNILSGIDIKKLIAIVPGGEERSDSAYEGLKALDGSGCDIVLIHDGARPLVGVDVIERVVRGAIEGLFCVAAVPVKDTIREVGDDGFALSTPDRSHLWQMQTPQGCSYSLMMKSYEEFMSSSSEKTKVTDDAMVAGMIPGTRIRIVEGSYENIKVTTPDDLIMAEALMLRRLEKSL